MAKGDDRRALELAAREQRRRMYEARAASMSPVGRLGVALIPLLLLCLLILGLVRTCSSISTTPAETASPTDLANVLALQPGTPCENGGRVTQRDFAVERETTMLSEPQDGAAPVQMRVGQEQTPLLVEQEETVREICRAGQWSKVLIATAPPELQQVRGWVPSSSLRPVKTSKTGRRIYETADFEWPAGAATQKIALVRAMNRIMEERPDCLALDRQSFLPDPGHRSGFMIPCYVEGGMTSFEFTAQDATNGRSFAPVDPISKSDAIDACRDAGRARSTHPSTVVFPAFDIDFRDGGNGQTQLLTAFTAQNGFGLELKFDLQCDFEGTDLKNVVVSEAKAG